MIPDSQTEILEANTDTGTYWATYDYPSAPPSVAVPRALAALTGRRPTDLDSLYNATIDPDALDGLFRPEVSDQTSECTVEFKYHGYTIRVQNFGRIVVEESEESHFDIDTRVEDDLAGPVYSEEFR